MVFERIEAAKIVPEREIFFGHKFEEFLRSLDILAGRSVTGYEIERLIDYSFIDGRVNGFIKFMNK